ncbi:MAG: M28 family peptidase [Bacteroidota bacterium]|nr:M28 family peptidase [Bacteroidota bacterium]MDP3143938.1 M28 family peptidase [Bacteroidota bacterium]
MRSKTILLLIFFSFNFSFAQDTIYARKVIKFLTSKKCFGRGYLNNGLDVAAKYISAELKANNARPYFYTGYFQWFDFNVNTFPNKVIVKVNNKLLKPGIDYIINPESTSLKGKYSLEKKDSVTYITTNSEIPVTLNIKKKLTYSVATKSTAICAIDLLENNAKKNLSSLEVNIESKVLTKYINKNICAFIPGEINNDTMMVFSAHYDHLGGMGKSTFFPGANDNASGVSVLLNLVKYYSKNPPKYKTVFIFFAGEEAGLLGSRYFAESKVMDLKKIKFLVNLDLLGTGDDGIMVVNGYTFEKQFNLLDNINKEKNLVKEIKKRGKASNSDHYWFSEAGVPCFFIYTLGGIKAYHDVYDVAKTLPLTDYVDVFKLITEFADKL